MTSAGGGGGGGGGVIELEPPPHPAAKTRETSVAKLNRDSGLLFTMTSPRARIRSKFEKQKELEEL